MSPDAPETPAYVADGYVVDHHAPESYITRCPDCGEVDTHTSRPGEAVRICSDCGRLKGVTPVRPQRTGWAAEAATEDGEAMTDGGQPVADAGDGDDLPEFAYESAHRGQTGGKFHLDPDCPQLTTTTVSEVPLSAFPPAWRDWCSECGPDGELTRPPEDGSHKCSECGRHVGDPALDADGLCLGCQPDDEDDRRLVADGSGRFETPRVVGCDVERAGVHPDGEYHLDPNTVVFRVGYENHHGHDMRLEVTYRIEGGSAALYSVDLGHRGGGSEEFIFDVHLPAIFEADDRVADLAFVQGVSGIADRVRAAGTRPVAADGGGDDE